MNPRTLNEPAASAPRWSADERRALEALRTRYHVVGDQLTARELKRLLFWRWLYQAGRLIP